MKATGHAVFFGALDAAGINGETARHVCGEPGRPINSGTWSRMRKADPDDPKTPPLLVEHIDRALAELGPQFRAEYQRLWDTSFRPEPRHESDALLLDAVNFALGILDKVAAAQLAGKVA